MKTLLTIILMLSGMISSVHASTQVTVHVYRFTSSLSDMNRILELLLAEKAKLLCPNSRYIEVINPKIKLQTGPNTSENVLMGSIDLSQKDPKISLFSHPYGELTADLECKF